jgi:WS/DGAT/MGAT family acyltransferase
MTLPGAMSPGRPRRLLVVSANIGEGHNATAAALEERARQLWPDCEIRRVDTLDAMGRLTGPLFRWTYRVNVDRTPWLYDFFYRELWRQPWFAAASCRFTGVWASWGLRPVIEEFRPDLTVSTYPIGTGGLDWLRRRGRLDAPLAAMISDFAPHPFWVYSEVDLHYVASEPSLRAMYRARPDARGAVGAPPVVSAFRPRDRARARAELGLPAGVPLVLISCGSLGFGSVERAVDSALAAAPNVCVVVTCGRNEPLRARLVGRGEPTHRLVPMGWTDRMPELTAAADVVVTNAGGATALEALATGRTVLLFEPIAGHGKANAALMERAGLGIVCPDSASLTATLRGLFTDRERLAAAERRAVEHTGSLDFTAEVSALPGLPRHHGFRPLTASDALFVGAATPTVPQQVGAVLRVEPVDSAGPVDVDRLVEDIRGRLAERAGDLPMLHRRLWTAAHRRPRWSQVHEVDPAAHVIGARRLAEDSPAAWDRAVAEFFDAPLPMDRPPWQMQVLTAPGRVALLASLHHALGDGLAVTAALVGLLADRPVQAARRPAVPAAGGPRAGAGASADARVARPRSGPATPRRRRVVRGLLGLATAGRAAVAARRESSAQRTYTVVELPAARVRSLARELGTGTSALLLGVLGEGLYRHGGPGATANGRLRTAVPLTTQRVRRSDGVGNDTAALMLDLPVGPMPARDRVAEVARAMARLDEVGQSAAAGFAVRAAGRVPGLLHSRLCRLIYGGRFFSVIASVMPGLRRDVRIFGLRVSVVHPILPLADGVGLAVGFLSWGRVVGVGVTADRALFPDGAGLADTLARVIAELAGVAVSPNSDEVAQRV